MFYTPSPGTRTRENDTVKYYVMKNINKRFAMQHSQAAVVRGLCTVGWSLLPQEPLHFHFVLCGCNFLIKNLKRKNPTHNS